MTEQRRAKFFTYQIPCEFASMSDYNSKQRDKKYMNGFIVGVIEYRSENRQISAIIYYPDGLPFKSNVGRMHTLLRPINTRGVISHRHLTHRNKITGRDFLRVGEAIEINSSDYFRNLFEREHLIETI